MQTKHAGTIRGLGIAVVVLSAAALALCLLCAVLLGLTGTFFDSSLLDMATAEMARSGAFDELYGYGYSYGGYGMSGAEVDSILGFLVVVGGILLGWESITCVLTLIAGILAMKHAAKVEKLDKLFVWGIVGAVAAFLGGRLITMALLIVVAVFSNFDRNAAQTAQWQTQGFASVGAAGVGAGAAGVNASAAGVNASAGVDATQVQQPSAQAYTQVPQSAPKTYPQPSQAYQQAYGQPMQPVQPMRPAESAQSTAPTHPGNPSNPSDNSLHRE